MSGDRYLGADVVEAEYVDAFRVPRRVSDQDREAVLRAMATPEEPAAPAAHDPVRLLRRRGEGVSPPAELVLEDGTSLGIHDRLPADLPHGYHQLVRDSGTQLLLSAPDGMRRPSGYTWGWAAQLYAARSRDSWGVGDLADLRQLAGWAGGSGAQYLFLNPLYAPNPSPDPEASPYYTSTRRFHSPLYLRVEAVDGAARLSDQLAPLRAAGLALNGQRLIDRARVQRLKMDALQLIWQALPDARRGAAAGTYRAEQASALRAWGAFAALSERYGPGWRTWPAELRRPESPGVDAFVREQADRVAFHAWLQSLLDQQLAEAAAGGARLVADLPVGFDPSGFDAWCWQDVVSPAASIGAPPDRFNPAGQEWGVPPFVPHRLRAAGYRPFIETVRAALRHAAGLRIDHVLGLFRLWWVPAGRSPRQGAYVRYPTDELLAILAIESERAAALVLGEDLGTVGAGVRRRLRMAGVLSTRVAHFERDLARMPYLASASVSNHDLPTIAGAWTGSDLAELAALGVPHDPRAERGLAARLAALSGQPAGAPLAAVMTGAYGTLGASPAAIATISLEDAMAVAERVNVPGTSSRQRANWSLALPQPIETLAASPLVGELAAAMSAGRTSVAEGKR